MHTATIRNGRGEVVSINYLSNEPDWSATWNIRKIEQELEGFIFKGPGWYFTKTDSLLVFPTPRNDDGGDQLFTIMCWNNPNAMNTYTWIVNAPIQEDSR
jgi:hypothetical protein